eukprot:gene27621-34368_t
MTVSDPATAGTTVGKTGWSSIATSADGTHIYATVSHAVPGETATVVYSYDSGYSWATNIAYISIDGFYNAVCSQSGEYVAMYNLNYPTGQHSVFISSDFGQTYTVVYQSEVTGQGTFDALVMDLA